MNDFARQAESADDTDTVGAALEFAEGRLASGLREAFADRAELSREARSLLRLAAGLSEAQIFADRDRRLDTATRRRFIAIVARRAAGEPFAYIEQCRGFHALDLHVDSRVLIPRPETEIIVDAVVARAPPRPFSVVDLGTGSGAIALGIAHARPDARVTGVDVSAQALAVARGNADRLGLDVQFVRSNWFGGLPKQRFDFICSNPPYVRSGDPHLAQLRFEPRLALDGGSDGLREIRRILTAAPAWLTVCGRVLIEHGHDQADAVARIAHAAGFRTDARICDAGGHERVSVFLVGEAE